MGCQADVTDPCQTGPPAGYVEVGRVPASAFSFVDSNRGRGLETGVEFYRISATFGPPAGGKCPLRGHLRQAGLETPLITNVSVTSTDASAGEILVRFTQPSR